VKGSRRGRSLRRTSGERWLASRRVHLVHRRQLARVRARVLDTGSTGQRSTIAVFAAMLARRRSERHAQSGARLHPSGIASPRVVRARRWRHASRASGRRAAAAPRTGAGGLKFPSHRSATLTHGVMSGRVLVLTDSGGIPGRNDDARRALPDSARHDGAARHSDPRHESCDRDLREDDRERGPPHSRTSRRARSRPRRCGTERRPSDRGNPLDGTLDRRARLRESMAPAPALSASGA